MPTPITDAAGAAVILGTSRRTVFNYVHSRGLPVVRLGKRMLFDPEALAKWKKAQAKKQRG